MREKSELLTGYMEYLVYENNNGNVEIITPENKTERGCQLSIRAKQNGKFLHKKLNTAGVICDWREPDVIRCAPVPLYNTFMDIWKFTEILYSE